MPNKTTKDFFFKDFFMTVSQNAMRPDRAKIGSFLNLNHIWQDTRY